MGLKGGAEGGKGGGFDGERRGDEGRSEGKAVDEAGEGEGEHGVRAIGAVEKWGAEDGEAILIGSEEGFGAVEALGVTSGQEGLGNGGAEDNMGVGGPGVGELEQRLKALDMGGLEAMGGAVIEAVAKEDEGAGGFDKAGVGEGFQVAEPDDAVHPGVLEFVGMGWAAVDEADDAVAHGAAKAGNLGAGVVVDAVDDQGLAVIFHVVSVAC